MHRKEISRLLEEIHEHLYQANHTFVASIRRHLRTNLVDGLKDELTRSKPLSFLSFPVPECSCSRGDRSSKVSVNASSPSAQSPLHDVLTAMLQCPSWMDHSSPRDKDGDEDDVYEDDVDSADAAQLFQDSGESNEETSTKEETQIDDQEELEVGER